MEDKHMLMIPGPTPVPEKVLLSLAKHPIGHRSGDFSQIIAEINQKLQWLHQTKNEILSLNVSGTGAMEAGMINFLSPGDYKRKELVPNGVNLSILKSFAPS